MGRCHRFTFSGAGPVTRTADETVGSSRSQADGRTDSLSMTTQHTSESETSIGCKLDTFLHCVYNNISVRYQGLFRAHRKVKQAYIYLR